MGDEHDWIVKTCQYLTHTCTNTISVYILLFVDDDEHDWIVKTCRKGWDEYVGYTHKPAA